MKTDSAFPRYDAIAVTFHWLLAVLIAGQLWLGWRMSELPLGLAKYQLFQWHKSLGLLVFGLAILRLLWLRTTRPTASAPWLQTWERRLANGAHAALYVFMIGTPLLGWAIVSAAPGPAPTRWFGSFVIPSLPLGALIGNGWLDIYRSAHRVAAWSGGLLIILHVAGALKHQLIDRRPELQRMWPRIGGTRS